MSEFNAEQYTRAAKAAVAAGDREAANYFLKLARDSETQLGDSGPGPQGGNMWNGEEYFKDPRTNTWRPRSEYQAEIEGRGNTASDALTGLATGLSFGGGDEIVGLLSGAIEGKDVGATRQMMARNIRDKARADSPAAALTGEIVGGAIPSIATAPFAASATTPGLMARGAGLGAAEGGIYGALSGDTPEDRINNAVSGAALGAPIGAAAPVVIPAAIRAAQTPVNAIRNMTNKPSQRVANGLLADTIERSGRSVDDIADDVLRAARAGQPEYRAMDALGDAGARRTSGIANTNSRAAQEITEFLRDRQAAQSERVGQFVEDGFGFPGGSKPTGTDIVPQGYRFKETPAQVLARKTSSAQETVRRLENARSAVADEAYDKARAVADPVDVRGAIAAIEDRIGGMRGSGIKGDGIDAKLSGIRDRLFTETDQGAVELSDFSRVLGVKQDLGDMIGEATRAGRGNEARELMKVQTALDKALETASPLYRQANDDFRTASRVIDSVDEGAGMVKRGRAVDNVRRFEGMTPDQQQAARIGAGDKYLADIEVNKATTADKSRPFRSPKNSAQTEAMTIDPRTFSQRMANEGRMWDTQNTAIGNSTTARKAEDIAEVSGQTGAIRSLGNMRFGDAAAEALQPIKDALTGVNDETRILVARALMSGDPKEVLNVAMQQKMSAETRKRLVSAMSRSGLIRANSTK